VKSLHRCGMPGLLGLTIPKEYGGKRPEDATGLRHKWSRS